MNEAPERIWLDWPAANRGDVVYDEPPERDTQPGQTCYIRKDVHATALAALEADAAWARKRVGQLVQELADEAQRSADTRAVYEDRLNAMEADFAARIEELEAQVREAALALAHLERCAHVVSERGATTGPQWTRLTVAILKAREVLKRLPTPQAAGPQIVQSLARLEGGEQKHIRDMTTKEIGEHLFPHRRARLPQEENRDE